MPNVYSKAAITDPDLIEAYETCRGIVRRRNPGEYTLSRLLPPALQPAAWALWGSLAVADDLVDTTGSSRDRQAVLDEWTAAFDAELVQGHSPDPVRRGLVHTVLTWNVSPGDLHAVFRMYRQDPDAEQPLTWEQWVSHRQSFTTCVNQSTLVLFGAALEVPIRLRHIDAYKRWLNALFMMDSLEDLAEDINRDDVRWPVEAFEQAGAEPADLMRRRWTPGVEALISNVYSQVLDQLTHLELTGLPPWLTVLFEACNDMYLARLHAVRTAGPALLYRSPRVTRTVRWRILAPARIRAALTWHFTPIKAPITPARSLPGRMPTPTSPHSLAEPKPPLPHASGARPPTLPTERVPRHVAVIMDGNGRWATQRGLPRLEGHTVGEQALRDVIHGALEIGLSHLTVYAFSTENWKRPPQEVDALMALLRTFDSEHENELLQRDVRVRWAGIEQGLPADILDVLEHLQETTRHRTGLTCTVCVNYGGRAELARAAGALARAACAGLVDPARVSEHVLARYLPDPDMPDVDLLWRTGGEHRTSNFLPWQSAYAEICFTDTLWPDIDRRDLWEAISSYTRRERRYGTAPIPSSSPEPADKAPEESVRAGGRVCSPNRRLL